MKMNEIYEAPAVEIVKVAAEAGFQMSLPEGSDSGIGDMENGGDA